MLLNNFLQPNNQYDFGEPFTDWNGNDLNLDSDGRILASGDPKIHKQLLKIIQKIK